MQQPQTRPLLGDSVSSTTSPNARRTNSVAVLTHQQLQQLQQLQSSTGQPLTFAVQQPSNNPQEQNNGTATGNHIVYLNQLSQLNQSTINPSGTGMGLPPATPTFGVGLNMGLPLSLLNTSLTSLTSNVITTSNPLLNLGLNPSGLTAVNPALNTLNALNSNLPNNSISNGLTGLGQDLNGISTGISRLNALNSTSISSGLAGINSGISNVNPNITSLSSTINQNFATLNASISDTSSGVTPLNTLNSNLTPSSINSAINQNFNRSLNVLATGLTPSSSLNSCSTSFPFQTIQSIQSIAPHIVSSNIAQVPNSAISQHSITSANTVSQTPNLALGSSVLTSTSSTPILSTSTGQNNPTNVSHNHNVHINTMHANLSSNTTSASVPHNSAANDPISTLSHVTTLTTGHSGNYQTQRQFGQATSQNQMGMNTSGSHSTNQTSTTVKNVQSIQSQNVSSPGSPFSIPLKSPASNIAPPTPSPSPNRLVLRSPASNSIQSSRNSPSPVTNTTGNFSMQLQSPMQSPLSVGQIQSPAPSPYPPAKSPHHLGGGSNLNNRSPAPGGSPGPPVVRPNTPILQQGMQVLQIIHGGPQSYQQASSQLVTRAHLFGNQQIQIATAKPPKQPPQILPKPPNQQGVSPQQKQRVTTTITSQVTQQTQPQLVLAGPQQSPTTATMIPTAQGLLLNQVLPSSGPVIVQQQPGGVQLILRTPTNAQQQTHTAQLTQQQLVRVVTAQGMQLQGITPTFFAVPNGFPSAAQPVIRHTPTSPAPPNSGNNNPIVIQNAMVQSPQSQIAQVSSSTTTTTGVNIATNQPVIDQNLLPPPKKKAKKKKRAKKKDEDPPKLDLASIMKISGIGDDDDIFDNDLVPECESTHQQQQQQQPQLQLQVEQQNQVHHINQMTGQISATASQAQSVAQVNAINTTNIQQRQHQQQQQQHQQQQQQQQQAQNIGNSENFGSPLVSQLQMPVQNAISGQLRLAVGEDGRVVLHHTPEPNQPEIDQATAQALIRSLTQGGGQNSQIISQLLGHAQTLSQNAQNSPSNRVKAPKPQQQVGNQALGQVVTGTTTQANPAASPQQVQICAKLNYQQNNTNQTQNVTLQRNLTQHQQTPNSQQTLQVSPQAKSIQALNSGMQIGSGGVQLEPQSPKTTCPKFNEIHSPKLASSPANVGQQAKKGVTGNAGRLTKAQQSVQAQKNLQCGAQRSVAVAKNVRGAQQKVHQDQQQAQQNEQFNQHHQNLQQISAQTLQSLNQHQNLQKITVSGVPANSLNILQQQQQHQNSVNNNQHATMQLVQTSDGLHHQIIHHNAGINVEQGSQHLLNESHRVQQQDTSGVLSQQNVQTIQQNLQNVQQALQHQQQQSKGTTGISSSSNIQQHCDNQKLVMNSQQINHQQQTMQQQQQNIIFSNTTCPGNEQQTQPKQEPQSTEMMNSAATSILNNAPKITPEILNALSNLNPNDQLLIANANGQMQVISQQLLQQLLTGQLNATRPAVNQNQTQKIVIGESDGNSQNLQGVQINTPTSQIIVNSSGGAPTIQNNIQNIVVQAAPSQIPHQIQIQNSNFPSQFIDNLNQQQIRNLSNSQQSTTTTTTTTTAATANQPSTAKKPKIVKRTKANSSNNQNVANTQNVKTIASRPAVVSTTSTAMVKTESKVSIGFMPQSTAGTTTTTTPAMPTTTTIKVEPGTVGNGRLVSTTAPNVQTTVAPNGQMTQRTTRFIQLPVQKQQLLKNIQTQIQSILMRKANTQADQVALKKLYQEHAKIVSSGKVVSGANPPIATCSENAVTVPAAAMPPSPQAPGTCKNQTSTVQTQTQIPTSVMSRVTQYSSPNVQDIGCNAASPVITTIPQVQQSMPSLSTPSLQSMQTKQQPQQQAQQQSQNNQQQQKFYQPISNQILSPSSTSSQSNFSPTSGNSPPLQNTCQQTVTYQTSVQSATPSLSSASIQQTSITSQQSTQCQTDPPDIKPNIQLLSPIKQELQTPLQIQAQSGSPAGQATSPRVAGKCSRMQSPVNIAASPGTKQLTSPGGVNSSTVSPRQAVKRPATSPICRQINRSDLLEQQLKIDQNGATNPDVNTPFAGKRDACKRLVRYHCFNEQVLSAKDLAKADEIFEETAKHLLSKFNSMMNKYTYLLLMESMREVRTSELMMIDRTFVAEEESMLNKLREQEAKVNEEFKKEEKPLIKVKADLSDGGGGEIDEGDERIPTSLENVSIKRELEDDFSSIETDAKALIKASSCTSGDYDEWLEIQKELGVYPCAGSDSKARTTSPTNAVSTRLGPSKMERTRANGECRLAGAVAVAAAVVSAAASGVGGANTVKNTYEQDSSNPAEPERRWSAGATDLERDLLEDTDSLDGLALQTQCPANFSLGGNESANDHDITAHVQSAIDSILNLKKRPSTASSVSGVASSNTPSHSAQQQQQQQQQQTSDAKDTVLDQAVRSILGS